MPCNHCRHPEGPDAPELPTSQNRSAPGSSHALLALVIRRVPGRRSGPAGHFYRSGFAYRHTITAQRHTNPDIYRHVYAQRHRHAHIDADGDAYVDRDTLTPSPSGDTDIYPHTQLPRPPRPRLRRLRPLNH